MNEDDEDRAAILRRRQRFIFLALSGLTGAAGCEEPPPQVEMPQVVREQPLEEVPPATPIEETSDAVSETELATAAPDEPYVVDPAEVRHAEEAKRRAQRPQVCLSIGRPQVCLSRIPDTRHEIVCLWKHVKGDTDDEPA